MTHANKGKVIICSTPLSDTYDFTLRMHKNLEASHLVLSYFPIETRRMF